MLQYITLNDVISYCFMLYRLMLCLQLDLNREILIVIMQYVILCYAMLYYTLDDIIYDIMLFYLTVHDTTFNSIY